MAWHHRLGHQTYWTPACPRVTAGIFPFHKGYLVLPRFKQFSSRQQAFRIFLMSSECSTHYPDDVCSHSFEPSSVKPSHLSNCTAIGRLTSVIAQSHVHLHGTHGPTVVFGCLRCFGTQRVVQKRRYQMRILHPLQTPYVHYEGGRRPPPIPHSLTATGTIKKLLNSNSIAAKEAASRINWEAYISHKSGVRWHPQGAWRVQFSRRNHERNFFVRCECYFKISDYGFETAKKLAILYRRRLEKEWEELQQQWNQLDVAEALTRRHKKTGAELKIEQLPSTHAAAEAEASRISYTKESFNIQD